MFILFFFLKNAELNDAKVELSDFDASLEIAIMREDGEPYLLCKILSM